MWCARRRSVPPRSAPVCRFGAEAPRPPSSRATASAVRPRRGRASSASTWRCRSSASAQARSVAFELQSGRASCAVQDTAHLRVPAHRRRRALPLRRHSNPTAIATHHLRSAARVHRIAMASRRRTAGSTKALRFLGTPARILHASLRRRTGVAVNTSHSCRLRAAARPPYPLRRRNRPPPSHGTHDRLRARSRARCRPHRGGAYLCR